MSFRQRLIREHDNNGHGYHPWCTQCKPRRPTVQAPKSQKLKVDTILVVDGSTLVNVINGARIEGFAETLYEQNAKSDVVFIGLDAGGRSIGQWSLADVLMGNYTLDVV